MGEHVIMATSRLRTTENLQQRQPLQFQDQRAGATAGASFPTRAFGRDTPAYRTFLSAIIEGLIAYEAGKEVRHATTPLPVA
jgi:hypothetical protein